MSIRLFDEVVLERPKRPRVIVQISNVDATGYSLTEFPSAHFDFTGRSTLSEYPQSRYRISKATPEKRSAIKRQQLIRKNFGFDFRKLSTKELEECSEFLARFNK
jgi:hypothetical protein